MRVTWEWRRCSVYIVDTFLIRIDIRIDLAVVHPLFRPSCLCLYESFKAIRPFVRLPLCHFMRFWLIPICDNINIPNYRLKSIDLHKYIKVSITFPTCMESIIIEHKLSLLEYILHRFKNRTISISIIKILFLSLTPNKIGKYKGNIAVIYH